MSKIEYIGGDTIKKALDDKYRVYLCGDLQGLQKELECIVDKNLEIGTSYYKEYTADTPHYHTTVTEYNYVISGKVKILLIDEDRELEFGEDSLFVLSPDTKYAGKNQAGTRVYFVKLPGGNDKKVIEADEKVKKWLKAWDSKI